MNSRTIKTRNPPRVIAAAVLIGLFTIGFIVLAIWHSGAQIERARMTGRIIAKEFVPAPEDQVSLSRRGGLAVEKLEGDYILTVEVIGNGRTGKNYNVWINKERYNALEIGDSFDVGPYLVRE